jgi:hypothetical protein
MTASSYHDPEYEHYRDIVELEQNSTNVVEEESLDERRARYAQAHPREPRIAWGHVFLIACALALIPLDNGTMLAVVCTVYILASLGV